MTEAGFDLLPGAHPIIPVMFPGEDGARTAAEIADAMLDEGVYVIAFSYPVVPQGKARIRVQLSAGPHRGRRPAVRRGVRRGTRAPWPDGAAGRPAQADATRPAQAAPACPPSGVRRGAPAGSGRHADAG